MEIKKIMDKRITVALCLLTWNEIDGCKHDVPLIDRGAFDQIYCLDGGSTDGTVEYIRSQGIEVFGQMKPGLNQACKEAVSHCTGDAFVIFHPKGSIPVEDIYKFRAYFDSGYDLVIASRMMRGSVNEEDRCLFRPRKWFVLLLGFVAKLCFKKEGNTVWDVLHGFRGMRVESFNKMEISDNDPSVDIEMVCRSYKFHMKRIEFPTKEMKRISGTTHFKAFSTGKKLIRYILWEINRK